MGDDGAVLDDGLVVVTDTMVEGVHARLDWCTPGDIGWKSVAVNLSDIAAMGALPVAAVAAVTLPPEPAGIADALAGGMIDAVTASGCHLVGGDVTNGPRLVVTVTVIGRMPASVPPVLRSGAQVGDAVLVTGTLGGPAAAVRALNDGRPPPPAGAARLHRPTARTDLGADLAAAGVTAMIDVSDGLLADLGHIADRSGVGYALDPDLLPLGDGASVDDALAGGDDYELVVCHPDPEALVHAVGPGHLTVIGEVVASGRHPDRPGGYEHEVA